MAQAQLAGDAQGRSHHRARRRLAGDGKGGRREAARQGGGSRAEAAPSDDDIRRATRDSVRALMMIRAYRMRGHLYANLDPLGLEPQRDHEELASLDLRLPGGRLRPQDLHRPRARARISRPCAKCSRSCGAPIAAPSASSSSTSPIPAEKAWIQERVEGPDKEIQFTREGKRAILSKLIEAEGFENFFDVKYTGAKRFGLDGAEAMIPALEQIIKRGGQLGLKDIALGMAHRGRLNVLAPGDGQAAPRHLPRVQGRLGFARRSRWLRRRQISPWRVVGPRVRRQQRSSLADRQPVASRDRRSGRARQGARQAGSAQRRHRARRRRCRS